MGVHCLFLLHSVSIHLLAPFSSHCFSPGNSRFCPHSWTNKPGGDQVKLYFYGNRYVTHLGKDIENSQKKGLDIKAQGLANKKSKTDTNISVSLCHLLSIPFDPKYRNICIYSLSYSTFSYTHLLIFCSTFTKPQFTHIDADILILIVVYLICCIRIT